MSAVEWERWWRSMSGVVYGREVPRMMDVLAHAALLHCLLQRHGQQLRHLTLDTATAVHCGALSLHLEVGREWGSTRGWATSVMAGRCMPE